MEIPKSTVRFAQLVKECGRPEPVTLWVDPKKDSGFQAAVRGNRVMTVVQETVGTQKDFGLVGFHRAEHASYWIFPKSLDAFKGKRVIGIKYDLLKLPTPKGHVKSTAEPTRKPPPKDAEKQIKEQPKKPPPEPQPEKPKPQVRRFRVTIRSVATVEDDREVEAKTAKEAGELALQMVVDKPVELPAERVMRKVTGVRRL